MEQDPMELGGMGMVEGENMDINELKTFFMEWLESGVENGEYGDRLDNLRTIKRPDHMRLLVNLNHLRAQKPEMTRRLMRNPMPYMWALGQACRDVALSRDVAFTKLLRDNSIQIGFEGSFGHQLVSPRGLLSSFLRTLVCMEGIVTKCSNVRPKVVKSVHYCPATKQQSVKEYRDSTALDIGLDLGGRVRLPTGSVYPTKDQEGNLLETEFGLCKYKDRQTVTIQEMPERAPLGQLPRSVDVILDYDLVDRVKPGDRVQMIGVYKALASANNGTTSGLFRTVIIANHVQVLGKDVHSVQMTPKDIHNIREMAQRKDILELLGRSLAPSIYGHEHIKKAIVLQLLSGEEKNLANGTHLRGDINIMMVGDPSTAKSQLLRSVLHIAPLAINTTGRGSSGVGLTAAVTSDPETGERRLEAGAMVLADRGIVCIDEFDKMSEIDRVAIHEVMEQQTVTIAKAGIHASLNARCSVVAAANPVYGQYDKSRRPQENIGLPDSLLSRFDLLFVVLDQLDAQNDRAISEHVLRAHRYRRPGSDMEPERMDTPSLLDRDEDDASQEQESPIWEKYNALLHGAGNKASRAEVLCQAFLRKYVHYAKRRFHPVLTEDAREHISASYANLRAKQDAKTLPVTARSLETIIRLSTAHAKARLSPLVEERDCQAAMDLLNFALYHETQVEGGGASKGADDDAPAHGADQAKQNESDGDHTDTESVHSSQGQKRKGAPGQGAPEDKRARSERLEKGLGDMWAAQGPNVPYMTMDEFIEHLAADPTLAAMDVSQEEAEEFLQDVERKGKIIREGEFIHNTST